MEIDDETIFVIDKKFRLQWEKAQKTYVLLYPEGMVQLNNSAAEVLKLCDGNHTVNQVVEEIQSQIADQNIRNDVIEFIGDAYEQGWITEK